MFALKFFYCCQKNKIVASIFEPELTFKIDSELVQVPKWDAFNQSELIKQAENQLMNSVGVCAIAVDSALADKYGKSSYREWKKNPTEINTIREIIFIIRSAYAHKIPDVFWYIDSSRSQAIYELNTPFGIVNFDARNKQNTKLEFAHIGGVKTFIYLLERALKNI